MSASAMRLIPKLRVAEPTAATGSTIFGNWIWRISPSRAVTEPADVLSEMENHFQGRIAAKMNSG